MLVNLYIIPETKKYKDREIIYAFEELGQHRINTKIRIIQ